MINRMEELMDAIELGEVYALVKYLDKLGYNTKEVDLPELHDINQDFNKYLRERGIQERNK